MSQLMASVPSSITEPVTEIFHGVSVTDPYRWLEDQDAPRTRAWIEEQSRYARSYLDNIPDARAFVNAFENSSPSKPMIPSKSPVAAISSGSACRTKSSLASTCGKAQVARIVFWLIPRKGGPASTRQ